MKSIKRVVCTSLWNDEVVLNKYTAEDKYFMLYLLTNPYTTQLGIYNFPLKHVALDLGFTEDSVKSLINRFENQYKNIKFSENSGEIAIKNYLKHSIVSGGKPVFDCLVKEMRQVEDKELLSFICNGLATTDRTKLNATVNDFIDYLIKELDIKINTNNNDNERYVDESSTNRAKLQELEITEIINYLNERCKKKYYPKAEGNREYIRARLQEGFKKEDCFLVIDNMASKWLGDPKWDEYLRPATLFCKSKFDGYRNATVKAKRTAVGYGGQKYIVDDNNPILKTIRGGN